MKIRTTKPVKGNKYFTRTASGGYSYCIKGKPTDECDVLANCVGYACCAFNEEHEFGYEKYHLTCNAENFIERAIASKLSVYNDPMVGGILVWAKGRVGDGSDGAGHVAIVIEILARDAQGHPTKIRTAESGYGSSKPFWTAIRPNANGNWGSNSPYKYRGCIAPEGYRPEPAPQPTPTPTPAPSAELKVGDKVKIVGPGNASSYGDRWRAGGIGWERQILKIWTGRKFPYQVGNSTGTTGFYKAEALKKI